MWDDSTDSSNTRPQSPTALLARLATVRAVDLANGF